MREQVAVEAADRELRVVGTGHVMVAAMARPTAMDEQFVHQVPLLLPQVVTRHDHWRESLFFDVHDPSGAGDVVFFTLAHYPARGRMDSLQMGRVAGEQVLGYHDRAYDGDPHTMAVPGARVEVVRPWEEVRLWADPDTSAIGVDLVFRARTRPYGLRRGTMRAGDDLVWDQSHILQSGTYSGTYTAGGQVHEVDGWTGQRDHSWGIRDHGRCPLWLWFQIQLDDGFLGVWHWELADGAPVYTDGCWAGADGSDPVAVVRFEYDVDWVGDGAPAGTTPVTATATATASATAGDGAHGAPAAYGEHGEAVTGLAGTCRFVLADGRDIAVEAAGTFARPYEPFHRGGLNLMTVRTGDGRAGTAIYEVTGARHHRFFPDTVVEGMLPS
jgi:hypothetical protein